MASSTIDIQQKLNDLLADADKIVENLSKQYRDQVDLLGRLTMAVKGMVEALDPSKVSGLSEEFKKAAEAADNAKTKIEGAMTSAADETEKATGANKDLNKSVKDTTQSLNEMEGSISIIGGIGKAFSFIASSGMSALSVIGSIAGALFDFAKAVILFPYKILMGLIGMASQGGSSELAEAINNIRKEFGYLNKGAGKTIMDLSKSMKGPLASTGLSVWRTFGNLAERIKYFTEYAKNLGETVDAVFANLKAGSAEVLGAFNKALGFSAAGQKAIAQRSIATGVDINELNRQIANFSVQLSDRFGVTMKAVSHDVGEMMADFEHFGNLSVQELTQSAVFARKLGIEVKSLGKLVDKFLNFEDAANSAAQLSQAFGMNVDAFKLMQEQDPGKKLQMLRDSFFAAGRSIENATAQERRLLTTQSGLSESELALAFSQKSRSMTYDQIKKSGDSAQKSQLSQTEVLKKLAGAIDRIIKSGSAMQGGFFDRFVQGFTEGVRWSSEFRRMLRDLSRSLWVVQSAGRAVGRMFVQTFPGVLDMIRGFRQIFNPRQFRALMNKVKDAFKEFFLALTTNPSTAVSTFLDKIQAAFTDRLTAAGPGGRKFLDGLKSFFKAIIVIASSLLKIAMEAITKGAIYIFELLTGKRKLDVQMPDDGGFMREAFKPLVSVIFTYGPPLLEALKNLFGKIFDDLGNYLKTTVIPAVKEFLLTYIVQGILLYVLASGIVSGLGAVIRMIGAALFNPATIAAATTSAVGLEGFLLALRMIQLKDVARAGGIMVALAAAIGLGGVAMAMAIWGMSKILANVGTENILKSLLVLSLTVGNMILVAYATKALKTEDIVQAGIIMFLTSIALLKSGLALIISGAILASALKSSGAGVSDIAAALLVLSLTVGNMILVIYATKKLKPDNIVQAGITMFLTSIALLKSGLALIISGAVLARALKSSGASVSDIAVAMLALTGIIFNTIILVGALKIISKMISGDLLKGLPIIGLVLVGMIAVTYLAVRAFKGLKADEIKAISEAISSITYFIVAAGVVIAEALAIGAILTALGPFSAVILTGFAAIGVVVTAMIASIKVVISEIKELQLGSGFKEKLDAFISVFNAVSNFLDKFSTIASALSPGFFSSFFGRTNNLNDNLKQLTTFVEKLIGNRDGGGIIGLVRTIVESIRNITDADIKRGQEVVKIIEGFSTLIKSIVPSTDMLAHLDADDISRTLDSMGMLAINLKNAFKDLITKISSFIREVAEMNIGEGQARAITAVSTLLGALGSIITALTPSPELVKVLQRPTGSIIQGLDPVKLMQYREFIVQLYGAVGPLITSFGTFVSSLGGINFGSANEHTVNMFKAIGEIFSGFSAMLSGLMSAMSGAISRVDPARVGGMITLIIGRLGEFMSKVRQELPGLVTDMVTGFNNLQLTPAQGQLIRVKAKALEVIFGVIKNIGETIDSLSGGATFNGNQIFRKVLGMAHAMQWVYDPRHEVGNSIRVFIQRLTGNGPDDIKIPDNLKDRANKLKSLFEAIKVIGEAVEAGGEVNASALTNFGALIGKLFNPQDPIGAVLRNTITNLATFPDSSRATQKARSLGTLFNSIKVISDALGEISGGPSIEDINGTFFRLNESMKPGSQFNFFVQSLMGEGPYAGNRLTTVPEEQLRRTVGAVSSMVRLVNEVSTALGNLSDVNISSNLTRLSTNLGLGNNSTFTIQNRNFTVNVNVDVHVDARELENTLINRTGTRISHTPG